MRPEPHRSTLAMVPACSVGGDGNTIGGLSPNDRNVITGEFEELVIGGVE